MFKWNEIKFLDSDLKWYLFKHKCGAVVRGFAMADNSIRFVTVGCNISEELLCEFTHFAEIDTPTGDK